MIPRLKCAACSGLYRRQLEDGMLYFHACPQLPNPAYQPNLAKPAYDPRISIDRPGAVNENISSDPTLPAGTPIAAGTAPGTVAT
jgi:hypothetical protein